MQEERRERWENAVEWPLMVVAVLFLVAYAWPILEPRLPSTVIAACQAMTWIAWAVFAVDYFVRLWLSRNKRRFLTHNLVDLAVVVLPLLRPLRLLRVVRVLEVLNRAAGSSLRGRVIVYLIGSTSLVIFIAALAALDAERGNEEANISSFGEAMWWAFATVTTVGYGDRFPVTGTGRLVAVGLMLAGIALLGVVTATFASWLLERVASVEEESQAATRRDVAALAAEVAALREALDHDGRGGSTGASRSGC